MRAPFATIVLACVGLAALTSGGCNDATHDYAVAALGAENPAIPKGPLHRAGQPCLVCHGGIGPASSQFSMAGTVYLARGSTTPASGALVQILDVKGSVGSAQVNEAGNFFIPANQWQPTFPARPQVTLNGMSQPMSTIIGRDGSCGTCHADPPSPTTVGHVYVQNP